MPSTLKPTPYGNGRSADELDELDASLSDFDSCNDVSSTVTSDPGGSMTCKDDNPENCQMKPKCQQILMPTGEEEDGYTLCAFGDISLSNIHFVPGPLEALSPEKKPKKSISTELGPITKQYLPEVIRKILPRSPSKAFASPDFETIVNNLKRSQDKQVISGEPIIDHDNIVISPQPQRVIDFGVILGPRSGDIGEPIRCATPAGSLRENRKHPRWECGGGEGVGYRLGLKPAWVKLT